ncbi:hypothetical protein BHE74_00001773 [Ensete ventricosum]|nr:hypothetical protein GW17_00002380 [Ensete ventricosum]RWW89282.1 hypothetical protein BHE74_00001773 [Ensete ventricosum]
MRVDRVFSMVSAGSRGQRSSHVGTPRSGSFRWRSHTLFRTFRPLEPQLLDDPKRILRFPSRRNAPPQ